MPSTVAHFCSIGCLEIHPLPRLITPFCITLNYFVVFFDVIVRRASLRENDAEYLLAISIIINAAARSVTR